MQDTKVKNQLIVTMFNSLYHKGYSASKLNNILDEANVSKGGLYHHFKSKKDLALVSIEKVLGGAIYELWDKPLDVQSNIIEAIVKCIDSFEKFTLDDSNPFSVKSGCPLNNLSSELSAVDEDFAKAISAIYENWQDALIIALQKAKKLGEIADDVDEYSVSIFLISSIEGSIASAKVHNSIEIYKSSTQELKKYIIALKT